MELIDKISYTIVTAPRKENYLDRTISSLEETGFFKEARNLPLRLVAGSPEPHLDRFKRDRVRFLVDEMTESEAREWHWHGSGLGLRASKGHRRAMHPFRAKLGSQFTCIFEEDLKFCDGWMKRLDKCLEACIQKYKDRFLLSLYTPEETGPMDAYQNGRLLYERTYRFYGIQGVLWPNVVREAFMYETSVRPIDQDRGPGKTMDRTYQKPHDEMIGLTLESMRVPILATAPCLVQHVGTVSNAGTSETFIHRSKSFLERVV
jgi:hypothetical protein